MGNKETSGAPRASDLLFKVGFGSLPEEITGNTSPHGDPSPEEILIQQLRGSNSTYGESSPVNPIAEMISPVKQEVTERVIETIEAGLDESAATLTNEVTLEVEAGTLEVIKELEVISNQPLQPSDKKDEAGLSFQEKMERVSEIQKTDSSLTADINQRRQKERTVSPPRLNSLKKADEVDIKTNPVLSKIFANKKNDPHKKR
jgi:hypothetical protein